MKRRLEANIELICKLCKQEEWRDCVQCDFLVHYQTLDILISGSIYMLLHLSPLRLSFQNCVKWYVTCLPPKLFRWRTYYFHFIFRIRDSFWVRICTSPDHPMTFSDTSCSCLSVETIFQNCDTILVYPLASVDSLPKIPVDACLPDKVFKSTLFMAQQEGPFLIPFIVIFNRFVYQIYVTTTGIVIS